MREIEVNGVHLKFVDRGTGVPVVLVHGALADYRVWDTQLKALAAERRAVAYSLRGHYPNRHAGDCAVYDTPTHAEDLAGVIRSLGAGPAHLVGHSFGGRIAALTAIRHPHLVRSLTLAEPSIFTFVPGGTATDSAMTAHHKLADNLLGLTAGSGGPAAAAAFIDAMAAPREFAAFPERLREIVLANAHTLRPLLLARNTEPAKLFAPLPHLRAPILLVEGELSPRLFKLAVEGLRTALPGAEHVLMRGVAHGLHVEAPRYFTDLLQRFLGDK